MACPRSTFPDFNIRVFTQPLKRVYKPDVATICFYAFGVGAVVEEDHKFAAICLPAERRISFNLHSFESTSWHSRFSLSGVFLVSHFSIKASISPERELTFLGGFLESQNRLRTIVELESLGFAKHQRG